MVRYIATERLRRLIAQRNWRQKDFAEFVCVSRAQACAILNQKKPITPLVRKKILSIFKDESFESLFFETRCCYNNNDKEKSVVAKNNRKSNVKKRQAGK